MTETTLSEIARLLADLADRVTFLTRDPIASRLASRARELGGRLRPGDPARWALHEQTVTVEVDVPVAVVAETLVNEGTGAVVVVASHGPVGVVAERDVVAAVAAGRPIADMDAADLISPTLVTAKPDDTIACVAALMAQHHVRHIPLIDAGRIVGVLSALDLVRALAREPAPSD